MLLCICVYLSASLCVCVRAWVRMRAHASACQVRKLVCPQVPPLQAPHYADISTVFADSHNTYHSLSHCLRTNIFPGNTTKHHSIHLFLAQCKWQQIHWHSLQKLSACNVALTGTQLQKVCNKPLHSDSYQLKISNSNVKCQLDCATISLKCVGNNTHILPHMCFCCCYSPDELMTCCRGTVGVVISCEGLLRESPFAPCPHWPPEVVWQKDWWHGYVTS